MAHLGRCGGPVREMWWPSSGEVVTHTEMWWPSIEAPYCCPKVRAKIRLSAFSRWIVPCDGTWPWAVLLGWGGGGDRGRKTGKGPGVQNEKIKIKI